MDPKAIGIADLSVMIAMPIMKEVPPYTMLSLNKTLTALQKAGAKCSIQTEVGSSLVHHARSLLTHEFLKSEHNRLFWVDADIEWEPRAFLRMMALSQNHDCITAAYPLKRDRKAFHVTVNNNEGGEVTSDEDGCIPISGTGLGFTLLTREVVEAVSVKAPVVEFPERGELPYVFRTGIHNGKALGEDMAFFMDVADAGYQVWLDPTIELGHVGTKVYRGKLEDILKRVDDGDRTADGVESREGTAA